MHPTPQEQLRVLATIIAEVAADAQVPLAAQQRLSLAAGQLRRLAGNVSVRLAFLVQDNQETAALLVDLGRSSPPNAAHDVGGPATQLNEAAAHQANKALRAQLAELIRQLPDDDSGDVARARIAAQLRARTQADPTLNRPPGATRP
ncbi:MAG: hypothetical protein ACKV2O_22240 [Acidimicrobiales bacterium]